MPIGREAVTKTGGFFVVSTGFAGSEGGMFWFDFGGCGLHGSGMEILIAASEMAPFARTGGFADSVRDLAEGIAAAGHSVTVAMPFYRCVRENAALGARRSKMKFPVQVGAARLQCECWEAEESGGVKFLFFARDEYYDRTGLYGMDGQDYSDNAARFIFFAKAVAEAARQRHADVLHLLGWQPALAAVFLRESGGGVPTVLSPFSLEFQGNFWSHEFALTNLPGRYFSDSGLEFYGSMNFLKAGIVFSDAVVLPGGRAVAEMQTPAHGCGLENVLRQYADKLEGIATGVPETALGLVPRDSKAQAAARKKLFPKAAAGADAVFAAFDTASTAGAGLDLLFGALDRLAPAPVHVALLGAVPEALRMEFEVAVRRHAARLVHLGEPHEQGVSEVLAACDFVLLPGALEPGSVFAMRALRNGLVPIAAQCEGLHETVRDFDPVRESGNGLILHRRNVGALCDTLCRALQLGAADRALLSGRAGESDFSWKAAVARLDSLYGRLAARAGRMAA